MISIDIYNVSTRISGYLSGELFVSCRRDQETSISEERSQEKTKDPICGLAASDKTLIIARESGSVHR